MKPSKPTGKCAVRILAAILLAIAPGFAQAPGAGSVRIRLGASTSVVLFGQLNANDARAAIVTWTEALSRETLVRFETPRDVLLTPEQILQALKLGELDAFTATTPEYLRLAAYADPGLVLVNNPATMGAEEYVLLVHVEGDVKTVADLRGRRLSYLSGAMMALAWDWMETLLDASKLGSPESTFSQSTPQSKVSRAVLPVFFRQADACLVSRRAFETMGELNPQVLSSLRVLTASPKVVPVVVGMRRGCSPQQKEAFRAAMMGLSNSPRGRQILAVFGGSGMIATDTSVLAASADLVNSARTIRTRRAGAK